VKKEEQRWRNKNENKFFKLKDRYGIMYKLLNVTVKINYSEI